MKISVRTFLLISLTLFFVSNSIASPQVPDYLIYKGDTIPLYHLILEKYLNENNTSNEGDLFGLKFREGASTSCWRGYQAIYEIENDSLFLINIIGCRELYSELPLNQEDSDKRIKDIFGNKVRNNRVFIDWYSDEFSLPKGNLLRWDGVFHRIFEEELVVQIKKGKVERIINTTNYIDTPNKINRRYKDKISDAIFKELQKAEWKDTDECDCGEEYLIIINKKGRISKIIMTQYETKKEIKEFWEKREYNYCIRSMMKNLKHMRFDIIKTNGKPIEEKVRLEIWFEENKLENWTE